MNNREGMTRVEQKHKELEKKKSKAVHAGEEERYRALKYSTSMCEKFIPSRFFLCILGFIVLYIPLSNQDYKCQKAKNNGWIGCVTHTWSWETWDVWRQ